MKKIFSILLCLVLIFSIAFQCSLQSSAIAGADDVLIITAAVLSLASYGLTFYNISEFLYSEPFQNFCGALGLDVENACRLIAKNGKMFIEFTKVAWGTLVNKIKEKFSPTAPVQELALEATEPVYPSTITLDNGEVVPWNTFMLDPFLIYVTPLGNKLACYVTSSNNANMGATDPGVSITNSYLRFWCTGTGVFTRKILRNNENEWVDYDTWNMTYYPDYYKGQGGSFYTLDKPSNLTNPFGNYIQYRTIDWVYDNGTVTEESTPNSTPVGSETTTQTVQVGLDAQYFPGAVQSPAIEIADGSSVLIECPEGLIVNAGTVNATLTTDTSVITEELSAVTPESVKTRVQVNSDYVGSVDQVIADTPSVSLDSTNAGSAETDIETANKFRLPRSFLEGFPFSIPYSVYVGIQSFIAEPEAPIFRIPFTIERLGISEDMEVDLSQWNPVARLCRALLSLVWVAGLAMACGKFIKR